MFVPNDEPLWAGVKQTVTQFLRTLWRKGALLGEKVIVTELLAYGSLAEMLHAPDPVLRPRTAFLATYALCGFANLPSIGIQIGGLSALAPERRADLASLGLRAMVAGALASWCTASVAGLFLPA